VNRAGKIIARGLGPLNLESPEFATYLEAVLAQPRG
jgi:hypothetical protein